MIRWSEATTTGVWWESLGASWGSTRGSMSPLSPRLLRRSRDLKTSEITSRAFLTSGWAGSQLWRQPPKFWNQESSNKYNWPFLVRASHEDRGPIFPKVIKTLCFPLITMITCKKEDLIEESFLLSDYRLPCYWLTLRFICIEQYGIGNRMKNTRTSQRRAWREFRRKELS